MPEQGAETSAGKWLHATRVDDRVDAYLQLKPQVGAANVAPCHVKLNVAPNMK